MSNVSQDPRFADDRLRLYAQVTFGEAYELDDARMRAVQAVWESFGSPEAGTSSWLEQLRSTAAEMRRDFGSDAWQELLDTGWRLMTERFQAATESWKMEAAAISKVDNSLIRTARESILREKIHRHFGRWKGEE